MSHARATTLGELEKKRRRKQSRDAKRKQERGEKREAETKDRQLAKNLRVEQPLERYFVYHFVVISADTWISLKLPGSTPYLSFRPRRSRSSPFSLRFYTTRRRPRIITSTRERK